MVNYQHLSTMISGKYLRSELYKSTNTKSGGAPCRTWMFLSLWGGELPQASLNTLIYTFTNVSNVGFSKNLIPVDGPQNNMFSSPPPTCSWNWHFRPAGSSQSQPRSLLPPNWASKLALLMVVIINMCLSSHTCLEWSPLDKHISGMVIGYVLHCWPIVSYLLNMPRHIPAPVDDAKIGKPDNKFCRFTQSYNLWYIENRPKRYSRMGWKWNSY